MREQSEKHKVCTSRLGVSVGGDDAFDGLQLLLHKLLRLHEQLLHNTHTIHATPHMLPHATTLLTNYSHIPMRCLVFNSIVKCSIQILSYCEKHTCTGWTGLGGGVKPICELFVACVSIFSIIFSMLGPDGFYF